MNLKTTLSVATLIRHTLLLSVVRQTLALTGLCQTPLGRATCFACSGASYPITELQNVPRDCCGDPYVYSLCERCLFDPESCTENNDDIKNSVGYSNSENDAHENDNTYSDSPSRRAKYLLGKRTYDGSFAQKRDNKPFLGKRGGTKAFLGKRPADGLLQDGDPQADRLDESVNKRPKQFLGKRVHSNAITYAENDEKNTPNDIMPLQVETLEYDNKRTKAFLGKRDDTNNDNNQDNDMMSKRQKPFLGKRDGATAALDTDDVMANDAITRRSKAFLGKRDGGGSKHFLGKRAPPSRSSGAPTIEELQTLYMRPLSRRAKYFLGKRSQVENGPLSKRQMYFLGKRKAAYDDTGSSPAQNQLDKPYSWSTNEFSILKASNQHRASLNDHEQELRSQSKRQKYFLGKRSTDDVIKAEMDSLDTNHM